MTDIVTILVAATANVTGPSFDAGDLKSGLTLETITTGSVSAFSVQLQGSLDAVSWVALGSPQTTATTAGVSTSTLARYFRAVLTGFTGTGTVTAKLGFTAGGGYTGAATSGRAGGLAPSGDTTGAADTAAIQALLSAGGAVSLQAGQFYTNATLTFTAGNSLAGAGGGLFTSTSPIIVTSISCLSTTAHGITGVDLGGVAIRHLQLSGAGTGSVDGVNFTWSNYTNTPFIQVEDVVVRGFGRDGISIQTPLALSMTGVMCRQNGRDNYSLYAGGTTITASSCWAEQGGRYDWNLDGIFYGNFSSCAAQSGTTAGWRLNNCHTLTFEACGSELQALDNWVVTGCNSIRITAPFIYGNNRYGIHVDGTSFHVAISEIFEVTPAGGAVWSIITDNGSVVSLENCGGIVTPTSLAGSFQTVTGDGAIAATAAVSGKTLTATAGGTTGRFMGFINTSGVPTLTGVLGDWYVDIGGPTIWVCTTAGSPATFKACGGVQNSGFTSIASSIQAFGNIAVEDAGGGYLVKEGSNAKQGTATLAGGTKVVSNTSVTASSRIFLTCNAPGGTPGWLQVSARTAGTSFTILSSSASDTSVVAYEIFEPA